MNRAIEEAIKTPISEIPVGCIITCNNKIIASCHNRKEEYNDITAHAEILAIKEAQSKLNRWRLDDCTMYVTLEPCPMCAWAILQSRINTLYIGAYNNQCGAFGSVINLKQIANSSIKIYTGIEEEKCDNILEVFFNRLRNDNHKK